LKVENTGKEIKTDLETARPSPIQTAVEDEKSERAL
jgi:hypothetical protein